MTESRPAERKRVLITVMTYPHPSEKYLELVCTAGVTENGEWVRLYPIDYRYRPRRQQFHKYQWIDVDLLPPEPRRDNRKESYRPLLDTIQLVGEKLDTKRNWASRREIIDRLPQLTLNELKQQHDADKKANLLRTSLGVVCPTRVLDLDIRPAPGEWKPKWKQDIDQLRLFGEQRKPLEKIPFTFHYIFECADSGGKTHTAMCEDWELGVLYLKPVERLGSEQAAAKSVKRKFFDELCGPTKDTRFFMGTKYPYNVWLVLGVFWPPKPTASGKKRVAKRTPHTPGLFDLLDTSDEG
jgi:hypothetical protein